MTNAGSMAGYDVTEYFALADCGVLADDDKVELLEGLIVSMSPPSPLHDTIVHHVQKLLEERLPIGTLVRSQMSFVASAKSAPQPDIAVLPGRNVDYLRRRPSAAWLLVEVSDSSLIQDRLTKAAIYARAGVPSYWIVNLRDNCVECFEKPDSERGCYLAITRASGEEGLPLAAFPETKLRACDLFPQQ